MSKKRTNLNCQGMSRRSKSLMSAIVADPNYVIISTDLSAAEPTITAHYSQDPNYRLAVVDMQGKAPYYNEDGMLVISDIYLMVASRFPLWSDAISEIFNSMYDGKTFAEKWLEDSEYLTKGPLKKIRNIAKTLALALAYGVGPKKMVMISLQAGYPLTVKQAKEFFKLYWDTFPRVKILSDFLAEKFKRDGYLQTDFGYCLYPDADYKCLNAVIQSTVSGIINYFSYKFFRKVPEVFFNTIIHDELIFQVPIEDKDRIKEVFFDCVKELNDELGWSVDIGFGWKEGMNYYEAK